MIDDERRRAIWSKMTTVAGKDESKYRLDACGALMDWGKYGVSFERFKEYHLKQIGRR